MSQDQLAAADLEHSGSPGSMLMHAKETAFPEASALCLRLIRRAVCATVLQRRGDFPQLFQHYQGGDGITESLVSPAYRLWNMSAPLLYHCP